MKLQEDLSALENWQQAEVVDETICIEMLYHECFTPKKKQIITPYRLHNHLLLHVNHYKYLGIIIPMI